MEEKLNFFNGVRTHEKVGEIGWAWEAPHFKFSLRLKCGHGWSKTERMRLTVDLPTGRSIRGAMKGGWTSNKPACCCSRRQTQKRSASSGFGKHRGDLRSFLQSVLVSDQPRIPLITQGGSQLSEVVLLSYLGEARK